MDTNESFRFYFRIPMFTDKGNFQEFQYFKLGEQEECTLCGYNGKSQQCTGLQDKNGTLIYEGDILYCPNNDYVKYLVKKEKPYTEYVLYDYQKGHECNWYFNQISETKIENDILINLEIIGNIYEPNKYKDVVEAIKGVE